MKTHLIAIYVLLGVAFIGLTCHGDGHDRLNENLLKHYALSDSTFAAQNDVNGLLVTRIDSLEARGPVVDTLKFYTHTSRTIFHAGRDTLWIGTPYLCTMIHASISCPDSLDPRDEPW